MRHEFRAAVRHRGIFGLCDAGRYPARIIDSRTYLTPEMGTMSVNLVRSGKHIVLHGMRGVHVAT